MLIFVDNQTFGLPSLVAMKLNFLSLDRKHKKRWWKITKPALVFVLGLMSSVCSGLVFLYILWVSGIPKPTTWAEAWGLALTASLFRPPAKVLWWLSIVFIFLTVAIAATWFSSGNAGRKDKSKR